MQLKEFLDSRVDIYNSPDFIADDPVCIPHRFTVKQDIEIMGFFAAVLAWGQRKTIINKCTELIQRMDGTPYEFVRNHTDNDLKQLLGFRHRTFNDTDLLYFIRFFHHHYSHYPSLENAFIPPAVHGEFRTEYLEESPVPPVDIELESAACYLHELRSGFDVETALNHFQTYFFSLDDYPERTKKHISSPRRNSACKRLNMFLRWMVRADGRGVDFGLWKRLSPGQLICPCDVHVERVARKLGLITRKQADWKMALELTGNLRLLDAADPVKYDFALFGLGIEGEL